LLLASPRRHALVRKKHVTVADLRTERFLLLTEMHCLGQQIVSYCRAHECQPPIACRNAQIATMLALVEKGLGITLLPEMAVQQKPGGKIVYRLLTEDPPRRTIGVLWRKHRYHSAATMRFLEMLRSQFAKRGIA
jgi:LysR family hydrogen peroxide-inducible transcriptional activator